MTREEILALEPGEKLDELLEQKVFGDVSGLIPRRLSDSWWGVGFIVEAMARKGWCVGLYTMSLSPVSVEAYFVPTTTGRRAAKAERPTAPHAVALAAILALEEEGS